MASPKPSEIEKQNYTFVQAGETWPLATWPAA